MVKRWDFHDDLNGMRDFRNGRYVLFSDYDALAERCERLEAALLWYALGDNYYAQPGAGNPALTDSGNIAREALSGSSGRKDG